MDVIVRPINAALSTIIAETPSPFAELDAVQDLVELVQKQHQHQMPQL